MDAIPTEVFTWDKGTCTLSAMASDGPLYELFRTRNVPDSLILRSHRTGKDVEFVLYDEIPYPENEIAGWEYRPRNRNVMVKVIIHND